VIGGSAIDYTLTTQGYADEPGGDMPARLATLQLECYGNATADYTEHWIGFRSADKHPMAGGYHHVALWEIEDATPITGDTTAVTVGAASPGTGNSALRCTFASGSGWLQRAAFTLAGLSLRADDVGTFLVLLRAANSAAGSVIEAQLRCGFPDNITLYSEIAQLTLGTFQVFNLGLLTLPFRDYRAAANMAALVTDGDAEIQIWLRRLSGTATTDLDCLTLLPADEFLLHATNLRVGNAETLYPIWGYIGQAPEGHFGAVSAEVRDVISYHRASAEVAASGEGVPIGPGQLYLVSVRADGTNSIADQVTVTPFVYTRWCSLRGTRSRWVDWPGGS